MSACPDEIEEPVMKTILRFYPFMVLFTLLLVAAKPFPATFRAPTATLSGTITYSGHGVSGVAVTLFCNDVQQGPITTGSSGTYTFPVSNGWNCMLFVRPPFALHLAFRNWGTTISGNKTKNFALVDGYRLKGVFHKPDGSLYNKTFWMGLTPWVFPIPSGEWIGETVYNGAFDLVVPTSDIYRLQLEQPPYYVPTDRFDMRFGDLTGQVITLLDQPPEGVPSIPPDASKITVSSTDVDGQAYVSGSPGAVLPSSWVILVNLNTRNIALNLANPDGSFGIYMFAPPGSAILIKYDIDGWRTKALVNQLTTSTGAVTYIETNPLPGTIINVGPFPVPDQNVMSFFVAGHFAEDPSTTYPGGRWAGWWLTGNVVVPHGYDPLHVPWAGRVDLTNLVMHVTSPAMNCANPPAISVWFDIYLRYLFDGSGKPLPWGAWFTSELFTPTGMPIEHEHAGDRYKMVTVTFSSFTCDSTYAATSTVQSTFFNVPDSMAVGIYQITPGAHTTTVPLATFAQAPTAYVWNYYSNGSDIAPLVVGDPATPQIPWTMFGDYVLDGKRGVQALDNQGKYEMVNRVTYPSEKFVVPRSDPRTGELLTYRLEPGSYWVSGNDRRFPNPPRLSLVPNWGFLQVDIYKPSGEVDTLGMALFTQSSARSPTTQNGLQVAEGTGQINDLYHLTTRNSAFDYQFDQYGLHYITLDGWIQDTYGIYYGISGTYAIEVARILDIDPAQLPSMPYVADNYFAPGIHVYPPVPAQVEIKVTQPEVIGGTTCSFSSYAVKTITGQANRFGYFFPPPGPPLVQMECPGEFRIDISADYTDPGGTRWVGSVTWGSVIEGLSNLEAHGRRGMDYTGPINYSNPTWFRVQDLPSNLVGIENYYPYWSGDIHWGNQDIQPGDSIHTILTFKDKTPGGDFYNLLKTEFNLCQTGYRWPPTAIDPTGLQARIDIGEAPLCISTSGKRDPAIFPDDIRLWGYWYGSSERPDVHVRDLISEDNMGTAYWRFNDTYNMQIGEGAMGDLPLDLKWEFGGIVFRMDDPFVREYAIYSSLWTLLPDGGDAYGFARVTPPFRGAGALNGGPIMTLQGNEIDMLFMPKGVRPGDILEVGNTVSFSGNVGPPVDAYVQAIITSPSNVQHTCTGNANKIGWFYKHTCDFVANEPGRWTVDVYVDYFKIYAPTGALISSYNTGTVLGTEGLYEFYVVQPGSKSLAIMSPKPGTLPWIDGRAQSSNRIQPIQIQGIAPAGTTKVYYTVYDKGVVMGQGELPTSPSGIFNYTYDPKALNATFPMISLTAHDGKWEGLANEVSIRFLAAGTDSPRAASVTLIGEEVFIDNPLLFIYLPATMR
jgi:hypothetical protein